MIYKSRLLFACNGGAYGFDVFPLIEPDEEWLEKILKMADTICKRRQLQTK